MKNIRDILGNFFKKEKPDEHISNDEYNLIRRESFQYKKEREDIELDDFIKKIVFYLKQKGWEAQEIISSFNDFFKSENLENIWDTIANKIILWAGFNISNNVSENIEDKYE